LLGLARLHAATSGVHVALSKAVDPKTIAIDGRVTYVITLTSSGTVAAEDVTVWDVLPGGFTYCCGTGKVTVNGVTVTGLNPSVSGCTLTWSEFRLRGGQSNNYYRTTLSCSAVEAWEQ